MLADTLDNGDGAAVADSEALADLPGDEKLAGSGTVQDGVAGEHVATLGGVVAGADGDGAARETFADVIVGFPVKIQSEAFGEKSAKTLPGGAVKFVNGCGVAGLLEAEPHSLAAEMAADAAVKIINDSWTRGLRVGLLQKFLNFHATGFGHGSLLRHDAGRLGDRNDEQGVEAGFSFEAIVPAAKFG